MQLLKGKCEFGDFELKPDAGWRISQKFIDYESGLLVVNTSDENEDHWTDTGFGSKSIPGKQYLIDAAEGRILDEQEWSARFSYDPVETISEDGKYRQITTRMHRVGGRNDFIKEVVIDLQSGNQVSSSEHVAFHGKKRETLLEALYRRKKEDEERKAKLLAMPTLQQYFEREWERLPDGDVLLYYFNKEFIYQLTFQNNVFQLRRKNEKWKTNLDFRQLKYEDYQRYDRIEAFRDAFMMSKAWYLLHTPFRDTREDREPNFVMKKFVVEFLNQLRKDHAFTYDEYFRLNVWESMFFLPDSVKPSEYKQYCSNCGMEVSYNPRYPKYICGDCSEKRMTDEDGTELSFSNVGMSGGLRIVYRDGDRIIREDTSKSEKLCIIDGKRFIATEARFGGIVIQAEE